MDKQQRLRLVMKHLQTGEVTSRQHLSDLLREHDGVSIGLDSLGRDLIYLNYRLHPDGRYRPVIWDVQRDEILRSVRAFGKAFIHKALYAPYTVVIETDHGMAERARQYLDALMQDEKLHDMKIDKIEGAIAQDNICVAFFAKAEDAKKFEKKIKRLSK